MESSSSDGENASEAATAKKTAFGLWQQRSNTDNFNSESRDGGNSSEKTMELYHNTSDENQLEKNKTICIRNHMKNIQPFSSDRSSCSECEVHERNPYKRKITLKPNPGRVTFLKTPLVPMVHKSSGQNVSTLVLLKRSDLKMYNDLMINSKLSSSETIDEICRITPNKFSIRQGLVLLEIYKFRPKVDKGSLYLKELHIGLSKNNIEDSYYFLLTAVCFCLRDWKRYTLQNDAPNFSKLDEVLECCNCLLHFTQPCAAKAKVSTNLGEYYHHLVSVFPRSPKVRNLAVENFTRAREMFLEDDDVHNKYWSTLCLLRILQVRLGINYKSVENASLDLHLFVMVFDHFPDVVDMIEIDKRLYSLTGEIKEARNDMEGDTYKSLAEKHYCLLLHIYSYWTHIGKCDTALKNINHFTVKTDDKFENLLMFYESLLLEPFEWHPLAPRPVVLLHSGDIIPQNNTVLINERICVYIRENHSPELGQGSTNGISNKDPCRLPVVYYY